MWLVAAGLGVGLLSAPAVAQADGSGAQAAGTYTISKASASYLLAGNSLFPQGADAGVVKVALPFAVNIYGTRRTSAWVSTNGNMQFGETGSNTWTNGCLPSSAFGSSGPVIAPYWDDILIRPNPGSPDGVFTKTYGTAPNRKFVVSWRGVDYSTLTVAVRVEAVLHEGKQYFDLIYADGDGYDATIGVQNWARTSATQFLCNPGRHNVVTPGQRLRFTYNP